MNCMLMVKLPGMVLTVRTCVQDGKTHVRKIVSWRHAGQYDRRRSEA
jgi:hypothetical protein